MSAKTFGVLAVVGLVVAFSLSSTLVKRAESPGVLVAFWRMVTVTVVWNLVLLSTGRRVTPQNVRHHIGRASRTSGRLGFLQTEAYQVSSLGRAQCQAGDHVSGAATLEVAVSSGLADVAREAFVHAMSRASIVTALVAGFAWRYLPARAAEQPDEAIVSADADNVLATVNS